MKMTNSYKMIKTSIILEIKHITKENNQIQKVENSKKNLKMSKLKYNY